ncbi:MAG TPA: sugar isomerase [Lachnospiraceae bacterium]|nr:sugar isomerase [Lachnospiraceae bacterium]
MIDYFEKQLAELDHSIHSLDEKEFSRWADETVETLKSGHKIIVSGLGKNVPICEKFVGSMVSLGLDASFLHTNSAVHGDMGIVKDGDMLILLTKSGETSESVYFAGLLKDRKIKLWLLTFVRDSTLANEIQNKIILDLKHEGDLWNIMPNNSTTMNLIVLQGLVMVTAKRLGLDIGDFKRNHPGGHIGVMLQKKYPEEAGQYDGRSGMNR